MSENRIFTTSCENPEITASVTPVSSCDGIHVYKITVHLPRKMKPAPVTIVWKEAMRELLHAWHPQAAMHYAMHQVFGATQSRACFQFGAPMLATIGEKGTNVQTVALSDPIIHTTLKFWVDDLPQKNQVAYSVTLFDGESDAIDAYETLLRIDTRPLPFYETTTQVYPWWASCGWEIPPVPAAAEDPLYSSWYNFHQNPVADRLLNDLKIASEMGFKTVILDDGWQFSDPCAGDYKLCGEWQMAPEKFPDFKTFTESVHALGMKLMVWFGMPFIGMDTPLFETFKDRMLYAEGGYFNAGVVDIRYPEVREFLISHYRRFLIDYDIDGFKFDFIDAFEPRENPPPYKPDVMDYETTVEAVQRLMTDIKEQLGAIKPDLLYEYRQTYIGPAINGFGNMLRVCDCAYESDINRAFGADLRLLGYPLAIHSDMLFWAPDESFRLCNRQLLNILFMVPQISVILADSTEEQKALLRAYLDYWTANRDILMHGKFRPYHPEFNYTRITAEGADRSITVLHDDQPYTYEGRACDVFHNGEVDGLIFENPTDKTLEAEISTMFGKNVIAKTTVAPNSIVRLPVPPAGLLRIR